MALIEQLKEEQKTAMKAKDKIRLGTIRLALAAIKQREVDEKITLNDDDIVAVLTKMIKQRRDSVSQYESAGRQDLADVESAEISVLEAFMPKPLSEDEIMTLINDVIANYGEASNKEMGLIMADLKPLLQGRADMGKVSALVRSKLS